MRPAPDRLHIANQIVERIILELEAIVENLQLQTKQLPVMRLILAILQRATKSLRPAPPELYCEYLTGLLLLPVLISIAKSRLHSSDDPLFCYPYKRPKRFLYAPRPTIC